MARPKPNLRLDKEFEWVGREYKRKKRFMCCNHGADVWGPYYFYDKHYPFLNGYYECEMAEAICGTNYGYVHSFVGRK